ncbi:MAG: hypothetical protein PWQ60_2432 [Thermoanaerobacteraceae bacterium]|nr:hypothetical protein [Thermoanaerobacteraceae bacterium]
MPRGDGTGPLGLGPMTGRAAGFCAGFPVPGYMNPVGRFWPRAVGYGLGLGLGFGAGRGWRRRYYATGLPFWARRYYPFDPVAVYPAAEDEQKYEAEALSQEAKILKEQLKEIEARLEELKRAKKEGPDEEKDQA